MNNAAVDNNIEPDCQQIEMDFCKKLFQTLQGPATQQTCSLSQK